MYFAFTSPFSYKESIEKIDRIETLSLDNDNIYFKRETIVYSLEKRKMELITITDTSEMTEEEEPLIKGCFPLYKKGNISRPKIFNKPTIFFSARVHPGETPASHTLNGALDVISDFDNPISQELLRRFVFKIIPILNPDGVYRGHYRLDTKGQNLNRYYVEPTLSIQPTIFAAKAAVQQQKTLGKLKVYIDFHAHAGKKG